MTTTGRPNDQRPALIDVETFFADPEFASASISPDGTVDGRPDVGPAAHRWGQALAA